MITEPCLAEQTEVSCQVADLVRQIEASRVGGLTALVAEQLPHHHEAEAPLVDGETTLFIVNRLLLQRADSGTGWMLSADGREYHGLYRRYAGLLDEWDLSDEWDLAYTLDPVPVSSAMLQEMLSDAAAAEDWYWLLQSAVDDEVSTHCRVCRDDKFQVVAQL